MFVRNSISREVEDLAESMRLSQRKLSVCRKMLMEVILHVIMHNITSSRSTDDESRDNISVHYHHS